VTSKGQGHDIIIFEVPYLNYISFTRSSKRRADIEQTSSKHPAGLMEPRPLALINVGLGLAHSWYRVI